MCIKGLVACATTIPMCIKRDEMTRMYKKIKLGNLFLSPIWLRPMGDEDSVHARNWWGLLGVEE